MFVLTHFYTKRQWYCFEILAWETS